MFGLVAGGACFLEVAYGPAGFAVLVGAGSSFEVSSGIQSVSQVGPGSEDGLSEIRCPYPGGGLAGDVGFGNEQGDLPGTLLELP